jgi:hypothetical protein
MAHRKAHYPAWLIIPLSVIVIWAMVNAYNNKQEKEYREQQSRENRIRQYLSQQSPFESQLRRSVLRMGKTCDSVTSVTPIQDKPGYYYVDCYNENYSFGTVSVIAKP